MTMRAPTVLGSISVEEVLKAWPEHLAARDAQTTFHRDAYENRKGFHAAPPSFAQYQALGAYLDALDLRGESWASDADRRRAHRETFGTAFPGAGDSDLQSILDEHLRAMSMAYDDELDSALGGVSL